MTLDSDLIVMAGPCSAESEHQIMRVAEEVKGAGAKYLRGGAWKPRTKGGDWEGYKKEALQWLQKARRQFDLKIVTEILGPADSDMTFREAIDLFLQHEVDLFQVGARNAQNQELLNALGEARVPVLLKNGMNTTLAEWYGSASRLAQDRTMLCARGKNNETDIARNGQDIATIAKLVNDGKYPIIFDPSHIAGKRELVYDITIGAVAMGVDGLIVEVHYDPIASRTDSRQAITPEQFRHLMTSAYAARHMHLEQRVAKERFAHASIPQHVDIYLRPESDADVRSVLGDITTKEYPPQKKTKILWARVPSNSVQRLEANGFTTGKLFYYHEGDRDPSAEGANLNSTGSREIHISPYSGEALKATGRKLGPASEGRDRVEYVNGFPGDRVRDTFLTVQLRVPQVNLDRLVLYRPFKE